MTNVFKKKTRFLSSFEDYLWKKLMAYTQPFLKKKKTNLWNNPAFSFHPPLQNFIKVQLISHQSLLQINIETSCVIHGGLH